MSYETLPTNLVDDVLNQEVNLQRRFVIKNFSTGEIINEDVIIEEITELDTTGSEMGSTLANKQNRIINQHSEDLAELERRGAMPNLDFANPLHTFSAENLSYTATKDCYLAGQLAASAVITLTIGGTKYARGIYDSQYDIRDFPVIGPIKISAGVTVTIDKATEFLHIFDVVS